MTKENNSKLILSRLKRLEIAVFGTAGNDTTKKKSKISGKSSLPGLIIQLRNQGFFKQPQGVQEVYKKLSSVYHCEADRIDTALRRLKEQKELRIASKIIKGKKVLAYVW
ncbi:MAG TPA: hypothetical protein HA250_00010 [Nanoarchaeota archaeon]|nr:hypothetical protein [Nanoarchaeota archaeon]